MSLDTTTTLPDIPPLDAIDEARRQIQICNACRYCEGYCSVFPAITRQKAFASGDITQLANLCHNCRGCYYACQYTEPHEFALNLPQILAEVRVDSWQKHAWPSPVARLFQRSGVALAAALIIGFACLFTAALYLRPEGGTGFYAYLSHGMMVAIFAPAFLLPLAAIAQSLRSYWREVGGMPVRLNHLRTAVASIASMRNLDGGQGQGCNFEDGDRYTNKRRWMHQAVMYGFLLCFASTSVATLMHYFIGWSAPYGLLTPPKLLGIPGGVLMIMGTIGLIRLKLQADPALGAPNVRGGEMAFVLLLLVIAATGLALYLLRETGAIAALLILHLGAVLTLFLLMPYSKMIHGFFRLAALIRDAQRPKEK